MPQPLRFGICTDQNMDWPETVDRWKYLEGLGFDSIWLCDHLIQPSRPEGPSISRSAATAVFLPQSPCEPQQNRRELVRLRDRAQVAGTLEDRTLCVADQPDIFGCSIDVHHVVERRLPMHDEGRGRDRGALAAAITLSN